MVIEVLWLMPISVRTSFNNGSKIWPNIFGKREAKAPNSLIFDNSDRKLFSTLRIELQYCIESVSCRPLTKRSSSFLVFSSIQRSKQCSTDNFRI